MLFNCRTGTKIDDSCIISVTTRDPISYPLPDRDLLRLQFNKEGFRPNTLISALNDLVGGGDGRKFSFWSEK